MSYEGLLSRLSSKPGSARSLSREGEGLIDLEAVAAGNGSLEVSRGFPLAGRGIPLGGRVVVLCCPSISTRVLLGFGQGEGRKVRDPLMSERDKECKGENQANRQICACLDTKNGDLRNVSEEVDCLHFTIPRWQPQAAFSRSVSDLYRTGLAVKHLVPSPFLHVRVYF